MSTLGIVFMVFTTLVMIEMLVHVIIFAKTGKGGSEEPAFQIYKEYLKKAKEKLSAPTAEREGVYPVRQA